MINKKYSPLLIEDLRKIRGYPLAHLERAPGKIPQSAGIYIWRYWPSLIDLSPNGFLEMIENWGRSHPEFEENVNNSRISVSVKRTPFGSRTGGAEFLGFPENSPKAKALWAAVNTSSEARKLLAYTLEALVSNAPPLYIGKADNLQSRLSDHFEETSSNLLQSIRDAGISKKDVYVSFIEDPLSVDLDRSISTALEEIVQRTTNPPLTKRYG